MHANTLLVLDDDQDSVKIITGAAISLGFEVKVVAELKRFFAEFSGWKPSHLAIHIVMPGINGVELLQQLAAASCTSAIILTSGTGSTALAAAQLAAIEHHLNVRGVLPRPFNRDLNNEILKNMLTDLTSVDLHSSYNGSVNTSPIIDQAAIDHAILNKQFRLCYQPLIDLPQGKVVGFEGLIRWHHPELGVKLPDAFIPLAEKTGQIDMLTELVIAMGFEFMGKISPKLSLSLNISAKNIKDSQLVNTVNHLCDEFDVDPKRVVLELTETATMNDPDEAEHVLNELRNKGFRLSIDDFGTGYSSMAQLAKLPFTELKIDKSFVTTMETSSKSRKVIGSTITLAESLGLVTVAEGIENSLAAIGLRELGCQFGQGYYFARPMEQDAAVSWLKNWNNQFR